MKKSLSKLVQDVLAGNQIAVSKALSLVDAGQDKIVELLYPDVKSALRIGITGSPGVGKSTLVALLGKNLKRKGLNPAVLAIDPTSELTGGALLGDRIRMLGSEIFIRSMATRMRKDGLSPNIYGAVHVLDAAGFNPIIVETVGVGQAAIGVKKLVDVVGLVLMPNSGDSVQVEKAGIFEIGDYFIINKSDLPGADLLFKELRSAGVQHILKTVASEGQGLEEVEQSFMSVKPHQEKRAEIWREEIRSAVLKLSVDKADSFLKDKLPKLKAGSYPGAVAIKLAAELG